MILYGAPVREKIKRRLIEKIKRLAREPILAVVQVGDREDSNIYIKQKQKFGEEIGAGVIIKKFLEDISEKDLILEIKKLNEDKNIDGMIVQLPLPQGLNREKILNSVSIQKDADGLVNSSLEPQVQKCLASLTEASTRNFSAEKYPCISELVAKKEVIPATARGAVALLDYYEIEIKNKKVAVIGQGILAGKPIADELEKRGAEVFRCDINTKNIPEISRECDILVSAVGKAELITKEFVRKGQVVVDVGISKMTLKSKFVGDVVFEEAEPIVFAITPVPGGVGPLTVACLFENLLDLCYLNS